MKKGNKKLYWIPNICALIIALGRYLIQGSASKEHKWKNKKIKQHYEKCVNE